MPKGFWITITNNLLEPKHHQAIGSALWEFMWCLDKMTKIDTSRGIGLVLGGKPIKLKDITKDIGGDENTVSRNLQKLQEGGYIQLIRTPYGNRVVVNKAKKRFNKIVDSVKDGLKRIHKSWSQNPTFGESNKTINSRTINNINDDIDIWGRKFTKDQLFKKYKNDRDHYNYKKSYETWLDEYRKAVVVR